MDITANTAEAVTVSLQELVDGKLCVLKKE
jgi:hypothetical protein